MGEQSDFGELYPGFEVADDAEPLPPCEIETYDDLKDAIFEATANYFHKVNNDRAPLIAGVLIAAMKMTGIGEGADDEESDETEEELKALGVARIG